MVMGYKSPPKSAEAKAEWLKWLANPNGETQQQLSKRIKTSETTLIIWKKAYTNQNKTKEEMGEEAFMAMLKAAKGGNATAGRVVMQAVGMLDEKQEDRNPTDFSPEQYIEIAIRIVNQLKQQYGQGGRNCPVCNRPPPIPTEVCVSSEQEHRPDSKVGSVALS